MNYKKPFSLDIYIAKHVYAHAELIDLNEVISESKKVEYFIKWIFDTRLKTVKENILGDSTKYNNFNVAQQYFKTVTSNVTKQGKSGRLTSSLVREGEMERDGMLIRERGDRGRNGRARG